MHLSASINIFSKGKIGEIGNTNTFNNILSGLTNVQVDDQSRSRWIIQPKFECPILNFADYGTDRSTMTLPTDREINSQSPIGMWHQYGRIPNEDEGIYFSINLL